MSDFNVKITVRNARLLNAIRAKFGTIAEMVRHYPEISPSQVSSLVGMTRTPYRADNGDLIAIASQLCEALNMTPHELWPERISRIKVLRSSTETEMTVESVGAIIEGPDRALIQRGMLGRWIDKLPPRDRIAIECEMAGLTLDQTGVELGGVTRERVRQIQARAGRRIKEMAIRDGVRSMIDLQ